MTDRRGARLAATDAPGPAGRAPAALPAQAVEDWLARLFIADPSASLRAEDRAKAREVADLLVEFERAVRRSSPVAGKGRRRGRTALAPLTLVDAAAGKGYVGLLAAPLVLAPLGRPARVILIERDEHRCRRIAEAAVRLTGSPVPDDTQASQATVHDASCMVPCNRVPAGHGNAQETRRGGSPLVSCIRVPSTQPMTTRTGVRPRAYAESPAMRSPAVHFEVRCGELADAGLWPTRPEIVVALHACGAASDQVIERATAARARHILLVPCCVAADIAPARRASQQATACGFPRQGELRRRYIEALVAAERVRALEAAGYRVEALPFTPPTVTPYNLLLRATLVAR